MRLDTHSPTMLQCLISWRSLRTLAPPNLGILLVMIAYVNDLPQPIANITLDLQSEVM